MWSKSVEVLNPYKALMGEETKPQTNADRIRAMSDEELCEFLGQYSFFEMCDEGCEACSYKGNCDKRLLEWLQQPAEKSPCPTAQED